MEKELKFIAERYRKGKFSVDRAWKRLDIAPSLRWRRIRIAAVVSSVVVLGAAAALIYQHSTQPATPYESIQEPVKTTAPAEITRVIDFENTPLPTVIARINEVYDVQIENIPKNAADYHLSLHYEGNAADLVATINDILELNLRVK